MKYTSAEAGKLIRKLERQLAYDLKMEDKSTFYHLAVGEDENAVRPEYSFEDSEENYRELCGKIRAVKHAVNQFNIVHELPGFPGLTIDQALVYIPQVKKRTETLQRMAAALPKERDSSDMFGFGKRSNIIDYRIANYNIPDAKEEYDRMTDLLSRLQLALDTVNTTETMDIDIEA